MNRKMMKTNNNNNNNNSRYQYSLNNVQRYRNRKGGSDSVAGMLTNNTNNTNNLIESAVPVIVPVNNASMQLNSLRGGLDSMTSNLGETDMTMNDINLANELAMSSMNGVNTNTYDNTDDNTSTTTSIRTERQTEGAIATETNGQNNLSFTNTRETESPSPSQITSTTTTSTVLIPNNNNDSIQQQMDTVDNLSETGKVPLSHYIAWFFIILFLIILFVLVIWWLIVTICPNQNADFNARDINARDICVSHNSAVGCNLTVGNSTKTATVTTSSLVVTPLYVNDMNVTMTEYNGSLVLESTGGPSVVTLPPNASKLKGFAVYILNNSAFGSFTVQPDGTDTINNSTTAINVPQSIFLLSSGRSVTTGVGEWKVIALN
jgi:hypothetical protein